MTFNWKNSGGSTTAALQATVTPGGAIVQGDFILVMLDQGGGIVTPPAGWTLIGAANNGSNAVVFWKIAGASEPSSYTFSWTTSGQYDWAIGSWSGIAGVPIDRSAQAQGSSAGPYVAPSVTPVGSADLLLCLWDIEHTGTYTPPPGMTTRLGVVTPGTTYFGISELQLASNAATGTKTKTTTVSGGGNVPFWATTIALTPAGVVQSAVPFTPKMRQYLRTAATQAPPAAPIVNNGNFNLSLPATNGQVVGTMTASGSPTSWAITAGNAAGYFAIDNTGKITVTAAGASGLTSGNYSLTCDATNAAGSGSGTAAVTATTSSGTTIPMSWNDARFAANVPGPIFGNPVSQGPTGTINNLDWNQNPGYASGDQCWTWNGGNLNMNQCRIDWREGPRIAGNGGVFAVDQCFINCVGKNADHADAFQAYSPQSVGTIKITNSCIRSYSDSAAAAKYGSGFIGSTALFWADYYSGSVIFQNVLLVGGSRVVTVNCDAGVTHVSFDHVYFVADPGQVWQFSSVQDGGTLVIDQWNEVRNATIVNGAIVPGALIPHP